MITIYLDHNIAHYFVRGFPNGDADRVLMEESALATAIGTIRMYGLWSQVGALSKQHQSERPVSHRSDSMIGYADFYERLMPLHTPTPAPPTSGDVH